jgi:hypothetical protein
MTEPQAPYKIPAADMAALDAALKATRDMEWDGTNGMRTVIIAEAILAAAPVYLRALYADVRRLMADYGDGDRIAAMPFGMSLDQVMAEKYEMQLDDADYPAAGEHPAVPDLDQLRRTAEQVSQQRGMATVIAAVGTGELAEFVVSRDVHGQYKDPVLGALIEAVRQRNQAGR